MSVQPVSPSVLVIGATGRTGLAVLRALQSARSHPAVHAMVRDPSKLPSDLASQCASITTGDASDDTAVKLALSKSMATHVVTCVGHPNARAITNVRAESARALATAMTESDARVIAVSSIGAGGSRIRLGFGTGTLMTWYLTRVLKDHDEQEMVLRKAFDTKPHHLLVVRPTGLGDGPATGRASVHGDNDFVKPSICRADVADWIVDQICGDGEWFGKAVVISTSK